MTEPASRGALETMIHHFPETFRSRSSEWMLAIILFLWGAVLINADSATISRFFGTLFVQWPIPLLAALTGACGLARVATLFVNGMWHRSPYIRMAMAMLSALFWTEISLGIAFSGIISTGLAVYPIFAIWEIYHVFRAAVDAKSKAVRLTTSAENGSGAG